MNFVLEVGLSMIRLVFFDEVVNVVWIVLMGIGCVDGFYVCIVWIDENIGWMC